MHDSWKSFSVDRLRSSRHLFREGACDPYHHWESWVILNLKVLKFDFSFSWPINVWPRTFDHKRCLTWNVSCNSSEKKVIYVTHQLEFLEAADFVLVIKDGELVRQIQNLYSKFGLVRKIPQNTLLIASSTDQSTVGMDIPFRLAGLVLALIQLIGSVILMSVVAWQVILLFLVIFALSAWCIALALPENYPGWLQFKRLQYCINFLNQSRGLQLFRCFNQEQDRFMKKVRSVIDDFSGVAFHNYATTKWLSVRMNFLFNLAFYIVLIILVTLPASAIYPSLVIWNLCNVENLMISVERILEFTRIPSEAPLVIEGWPNAGWPTEGKVELQNLQVQYHPALLMVIKGVTCTFPGNMKVGVVGRTRSGMSTLIRSGMSTLIQAPFRIVEPSGGKILVDRLDISKLGCKT
ncbi:hypothetical protein C1H46_025232 [Malus baccata]|uniref:ABC transmembrane type-1 domain-containing protein n=1 Tax=Malus baccata TaxID=106549 RepID=A0A540LSE7_MALBA|nr:hypothetical protein C1H46_025232 [Malus baccata]